VGPLRLDAAGDPTRARYDVLTYNGENKAARTATTEG
jgi:hypothetical protein